MLSVHNGFGAFDNHHNFQDSTTNNIRNKNYVLSYLQYPSQINLLNLSYKNFDFRLLNYGLFEDKIGNNLNNSFYSYEYLIKYQFYKKILEIANLNISFGGIYSKIESYTSSALVTDIKCYTHLKQSKINFALLIKNLGIILDSYTTYYQKLPFAIQFSLLKYMNQPQIYVGYDVIHNYNTKNLEHIISLQASINKFIKLRFSTTNYRNNLMVAHSNKDLFYGFAFGIAIETEKQSLIDIGISSLGAAGYVYGLTINF